jgi:hypothetical protein
MSEKTDKIKKHFSDNKKVYIGIGIGVAVTTTVVIVKGRSIAGVEVSPKITQLLSWKPSATQNVVVELIERSTPSKPVHLVGTSLYFSSLSEAARETGHALSKISKNVNGHIPDVNGDVFVLLETAS